MMTELKMRISGKIYGLYLSLRDDRVWEAGSMGGGKFCFFHDVVFISESSY